MQERKFMLNIEKFEEFISQYPIYEYRLLDTEEIKVRDRVRTICKEECERYGTTWDCPPAVGSLKECKERIHRYQKGIFFSMRYSRIVKHQDVSVPR